MGIRVINISTIYLLTFLLIVHSSISLNIGTHDVLTCIDCHALKVSIPVRNIIVTRTSDISLIALTTSHIMTDYINREHISTRIYGGNSIVLRSVTFYTTLETVTNLIAIIGNFVTATIVDMEPTATSTLPVATDTILFTGIGISAPTFFIFQNISSIKIKPLDQFGIKLIHQSFHIRRIIQCIRTQHVFHSRINVEDEAIVIHQELACSKQLVNILKFRLDDSVIINYLSRINTNIGNHCIGSKLFKMHDQFLPIFNKESISNSLPAIFETIDSCNLHITISLCQTFVCGHKEVSAT